MARVDQVWFYLPAGPGFQWFDVTADLANTNLKATRGFQSGAPQDLVAAPMTFTFAMKNGPDASGGARYYSPDDANCRNSFAVDLPVKWTSTVNGNTRTRFIGWVEQITPVEGIYGERITKVTALSWLNLAANSSVNAVGAQVNQRADQLLPYLVALTDHPPAATSYATTNDTYPYAFDDMTAMQSTVLDALDSLMKSGFDRLFEKADGTLVLESRSTRQAYMAPALTLADTPPDASHPGLCLTVAPARRLRSKVVNRVQVTTNPKRVDASPVVLARVDSSTNPAIPSGLTVTFDLPYVDPNLQAQGIAGINMLIRDGGGSGSGSTIGTSGNLPTADYQFFSGTTGGGTDVSASMAVSVVYGANRATVTVTNNGSTQAYLYLLQCRGQGIYSYTKAVGLAGPSGIGVLLPLECPYQTSLLFGNSAAAYYLAALELVKTDLEQGVQAFCHAGDELSIDTLQQLEISSALAISETQTGMSALPYFVNNITEEVDERSNTTFTFGLVIDLAGVAWALGIAGSTELGVTTTLQGF